MNSEVNEKKRKKETECNIRASIYISFTEAQTLIRLNIIFFLNKMCRIVENENTNSAISFVQNK